MKTITVAEFIDFLENSIITKKSFIDNHDTRENGCYYDLDEDYEVTGFGTSCLRYNYPDNQWIEYCENFKYTVDDGESEIITSDLLGDSEFRLTWDFHFTITAEDEYGDQYTLDDKEIIEIIENTLDLAVDYSSLEQYTLGEEDVA